MELYTTQAPRSPPNPGRARCGAVGRVEQGAEKVQGVGFRYMHIQRPNVVRNVEQSVDGSTKVLGTRVVDIQHALGRYVDAEVEFSWAWAGTLRDARVLERNSVAVQLFSQLLSVVPYGHLLLKVLDELDADLGRLVPAQNVRDKRHLGLHLHLRARALACARGARPGRAPSRARRAGHRRGPGCTKARRRARRRAARQIRRVGFRPA